MTPGVCEAALAALSARLGLPLAFDDDACSVMVGDQPFSIRRDGPGDRLVVSAIVADDLPDAPSRNPETGFIAAFAIFAGDRLIAPEFPDAFEKFAAFAQRLADRLDQERRSLPGGAGETSAAALAGFDVIHV